MTLKKEVMTLVCVFEDIENPFEEDSGDLLTLDTREVINNDVVETTKNIVQMGQQQHHIFVRERLVEKSKPINDHIHKNKLSFFSKKNVQHKQASKVSSLKDDCALFSRLYIAYQSHDGNLEEFFKDVKKPWSPSLAKQVRMRTGAKADLLGCLESIVETPEILPQMDAIVLDSAVIVHLLPL